MGSCNETTSDIIHMMKDQLYMIRNEFVKFLYNFKVQYNQKFKLQISDYGFLVLLYYIKTYIVQVFNLEFYKWVRLFSKFSI